MAIYRQTGKMTQLVPDAPHIPNTEILQRLKIMDNGFVFDPLSGKSYSINPNGLIIMRYIQEGMKLDQIISNLCKEFQVGREVIERDIHEFIISLQNQIK